MPKIPAAHAIRFLKHWDRRQRSRKYGKAFPKDQIPILLLEGVSDTAAESLKAAGYSNIEQVSSALKGTALTNALKEARILGIRSRTRLTADFLERAENLIAVGCFSVGTNQESVVRFERRLGTDFLHDFNELRHTRQPISGPAVNNSG
jgi:hypothetical protein